jgi:hypothetical protein
MIKNASTRDNLHGENAIWSEDILEAHHLRFREDEIELAKEKIISLFYEFNGEFPERKRIRQPK